LGKHDRVFIEISPGRPPEKGFKHTIELEEGAKPVITTTYHHPKKFKDQIEKYIKELLGMGHIRPSSSPFASSVVVVKKKYGMMRMCTNYSDLNKNTIKNSTISLELMSCYMNCMGQYTSPRLIFSQATIISGSEQDVHKTTFRCHYGHYEFLIMPSCGPRVDEINWESNFILCFRFTTYNYTHYLSLDPNMD